MDNDTAAKYIVGIVLFVAVIGIILMMIISVNMQTPFTGQMYSVKTKPVTCGDNTCQEWENSDNCPEDCSQSEVTGNTVQLGARGRRYIEDAG